MHRRQHQFYFKLGKSNLNPATVFTAEGKMALKVKTKI
jgi:hypothetical protein